ILLYSFLKRKSFKYLRLLLLYKRGYVMKEKVRGSYFSRSYDEKARNLRSYGVHVLQREEIQKSKRSPLLLVLLFLFLAVSFSTLFFFPSFTGFAFLGSENIVTFSLQEGWNLSDGFARISQNLSVYDISPLEPYVQDTTLSFDLDNYNLSEGYIYVDLILNETLVDSAYVYYQRQYISLEEELVEEVIVVENVTEENASIAMLEEPVVVQEESASILTAYSGFFVGNSSGAYQVDYVNVENETPYLSNNIILTCANGSISTDVTSLLYLWYVNGNTMRLQNQSTLATGNVSVHDKIECGIVPNGTNNFTVGNTASLNFTKNFTLEMWVFAREAANMELYHLDQFRIHIDGNILEIDFPLGANGTSQQLVGSGLFPLNTWKHIVFTYDNSTLSLYIDGSLDNSTSVSGRLGNYSGLLYFGKNDIGSTTHFRGFIDEVAAYNASLSAAVIHDQYKRGIVRLSRQNTLEVETTQAQFGNGTCNYVNCSLQIGNISLLNS